MITMDGVTDLGAEDALAVWAYHVPEAVELGRPWLALPDYDTGAVMLLSGPEDNPRVWWVGLARVQRLLCLPHGQAELTTFVDGEEVRRVIGRSDPG